MIDSINIAESGLLGFEAGLRTISNNTANLNTPGFKGSSTQFTDLFYADSSLESDGSPGVGEFGYGLDTLGTTLNFTPGQQTSTGDPLDVAENGQGYFVLQNAAGELHYTRDGEFKFDSTGTLVSASTGETVMGLDGNGNLVPISLTNLGTHAPKATTTVAFSGNLSSTTTADTVNNVTVIDAAGTTHTLSLALAAVSGQAGTWNVTLMDGTTKAGTGTISFSGGSIVSSSGKVAVTYTPSGGQAMPLTLDFSSNVTSFDSGTSSTLAFSHQDGFASGSLTGQSFDSTGTLILAYANGQTAKGPQLALAQFDSPDQVKAIGGNEFAALGSSGWTIGAAGTGQFGTVAGGEIEGSNVDLSSEFSNLVVMQRGYQACSQVISTASDMLSTLFGIWGK
ncbi:flagellar hook protein FlgE [Trinickia diaoshuihuensis]|uniref:flagellar hook protein FlgE n=1 Tax=Trinickia diaoshuihuensis TaxID=2292265 RepID=UPI000E266F0D|nr:flagellar hook-basal body complex protein [Trinickia diaoshuihuensis]